MVSSLVDLSCGPLLPFSVFNVHFPSQHLQANLVFDDSLLSTQGDDLDGTGPHLVVRVVDVEMWRKVLPHSFVRNDLSDWHPTSSVAGHRETVHSVAALRPQFVHKDLAQHIQPWSVLAVEHDFVALQTSFGGVIAVEASHASAVEQRTMISLPPLDHLQPSLLDPDSLIVTDEDVSPEPWFPVPPRVPVVVSVHRPCAGRRIVWVEHEITVVAVLWLF